MSKLKYFVKETTWGILVMPNDNSPGWLFQPGDIGYTWAKKLLEKSK